jgi:hypothetical protein
MDAERKPHENAEPSSKEISAAGLADLMSDVDRELALDDADADFTIILNNLTLAEAASAPTARGQIKEKRRAAYMRLDAYLRQLPLGDVRRQNLSFLWYQFDADGSPRFNDRGELVDHLAELDSCTRDARVPTDESFMNFVRASSGPGLTEADLTMLAARLKAAYVSRLAVPKTDKLRRNDPCPCGSGKKYKKCCGAAV